MRETVMRPRTIAVGLAALAVVVIVVAIVASIYIFGAGGATTGTAHEKGTVTVPTLVPTGGAIVFSIDSTSSKATFTIDEVLFGKPNTVVGETNQVAGQVLVDR